ncbi:hypothetical protein TNCV_301741 [Trichonephila clavipes]|nr:hypothetical protein TNCV_301741 [Trichonephila clavipes]
MSKLVSNTQCLANIGMQSRKYHSCKIWCKEAEEKNRNNNALVGHNTFIERCRKTEGFENTNPDGSRRLQFVSRDSRMDSYSNEELVDMLIEFGTVDCNGHSIQWLYQESNPNRRVSHYTSFTSVNKMLSKPGSLTRSTMNRQ